MATWYEEKKNTEAHDASDKKKRDWSEFRSENRYKKEQNYKNRST